MQADTFRTIQSAGYLTFLGIPFIFYAQHLSAGSDRTKYHDHTSNEGAETKRHGRLF